MTEARPDDIVQIIPADGLFAVYRNGVNAPYDTDGGGIVGPVNRSDSSFVRIERTTL